MAASIRKVCLLQLPRHVTAPGTRAWRAAGEQCRMFSTNPGTEDQDDGLLPDCKFSQEAQLLAARGYLRTQKSYSPPANVATQVQEICMKVMQSSDENTPFRDGHTKFTVLRQCSQALSHSVPNSLLHKITNIGELVAFYETEVNTRFPLDRMKDQNLPKNLHIIQNYTRFHPETDTKFGGVTVFTKDSNIVTGLKAKKKYPGFYVQSKWPYQ